jgi:rhamnosyltransferase
MTETANLAGVVIPYRPTNELHSNILSYLDLVDHLFIVDNTEAPDNSFYDRWANNRKVTVMLNRENVGISKAVNIAAQKAFEQGFLWLLVMDQDSSFKKESVIKYYNHFLALKEDPQIAVMGPRYTNQPYKESIQEVIALITSASIFNLDTFIKVGMYDERLFIDEVDHEYCYRVVAAGYKVVQLNDIRFFHNLGKTIQVKTLTGRRKETTIHKPFRLYYMVRNGLFVFKTYGKAFPEEIKDRKRSLRITIKNNMLYGGAFFTYLRFIIKGYFDFARNRFGKL